MRRALIFFLNPFKSCMASNRFLPHDSLNLPHLIIGYNHQKLTWTQFKTDCDQGPVSRQVPMTFSMLF